MRQYSLCIIGFGNVGRALGEILKNKSAFLREEHNIEFNITGVADSRGGVVSRDPLDIDILLETVKNKGSVGYYPDLGNINQTALEVIQLCQSDILIELTPTNIKDGEPALTYIRNALFQKMHVVTANKGPVVFAYSEILELARKQNKLFKFGGATAGALPTVNVGYYDLAGSEITSIEGIVNGTTNYILSRMTEDKLSFEEGLAEAQSLGIAERDPSLDIKGYDTAYKMIILAISLMGAKIRLDDIVRNGITEITPAHIAQAKEEGKVYKLLGRVFKEEGEVKVRVEPKAIALDHPLGRINKTQKAVTFHTDLIGSLTVSGGDAGRIPAAAAVLRDLINLSREDH
ncbi:MAG: hypothetical protein VR72_09360 [Clostridiaceae bacterium BRH_c20a]|nr:MAG: hypothetical protein VR72_09360 [Clostridiaceae bacterium BRH_c20a]